jgi:RNA polymerase sigma-70 factor (ECF subfamily)
MTDQRQRFEQEALPHLDAAYNLARWLTGSAPEAEDVVQEALLHAYRGFDGWRGASARPWLLAIVRNCYWSHARRHGPRSRLTASLDDADGPALDQLLSRDDPEQATMAAEEQRSLEAALGALLPEHREVLILRELEDLSYREIAAVIAVPIGTVMSRLARARAALRTQWLNAAGGTANALP